MFIALNGICVSNAHRRGVYMAPNCPINNTVEHASYVGMRTQGCNTCTLILACRGIITTVLSIIIEPDAYCQHNRAMDALRTVTERNHSSLNIKQNCIRFINITVAMITPSGGPVLNLRSVPLVIIHTNTHTINHLTVNSCIKIIDPKHREKSNTP